MFYPDPARQVREAAPLIGAVFEDLDNGGGYLFRVSRNGRSVVLGAGGVACFPVNSAPAYTLSRDKAHTKTVLRAAGLPVIQGGLFFVHQRRIGLRGPGRELPDAIAFAKQLGFPVFCKPNLGARGNFAEIIADADALADYARRVAVDFESFLIEPIITGVEHRVLVKDGAPVFHSVKSPPVLIGDGERTAGQLLAALNADLGSQALSAYPEASLAQSGHDPASIPAAGQRLVLAGRRNLSAAGSAEQVQLGAPHRLTGLAREALAALGLRLGAVDLFDVSPAGDFSDLVIIEVNGNPGLKTLELAGHGDVVRRLWADMLNEALGS